MNQTLSPTSPFGIKARILLSSVFGPYAQDDKYGSRKINPMELYQNQVTRFQGGFSLRMFVRSYGIILIKENLEAPCTLLDFPTLERFKQEVKTGDYDIIGISGITPNLGKVKKMCELIRQISPKSAIVVGGHIANKTDIDQQIDADYIVKGDGIKWFRHFLGQDENAPIKHPALLAGFGTRIVGVNVSNKPKDTAAALFPSVGCPLGCNFCSTSAFFGGKGKFVNFYETGKALYDVMCDIENKLKVNSFFIMDENFLLHRKRALDLLDLMKKNGKNWSTAIFSSANVLKKYTMTQLVELGVGWVWMGLEGEKSQYRKLKGIDTKKLVNELQENGIRVLGSSIIGLEEHAPNNIHQAIDYAVSHQTVFHQFMLYTPVSGTPLYQKLQEEGRLLSEEEFSVADAHGQFRFNYLHSHLKKGQEEKLLISAFQEDFKQNGPSLARLIQVLLNGWQRYKNHPDQRIRMRFAREVKPLKSSYAGAVWAMRKWYQQDYQMREKLNKLLFDIFSEFGWKTRVTATFIGQYIFSNLKKEDKRMREGWTYEPSIIYEKNRQALALEQPVVKIR